MGIMIDDLKFLLNAQHREVSFRKTLTLGRVEILLFNFELDQLLPYFVNPTPVRDYVNRAGLTEHISEYAEVLFHGLGADIVDSIDHSDFEGCTYVHDLNQPFPNHMHEQYDVVYDAGTLEHVFNYPQAIKNCMEAVKVGGTIISVAPTNNQCGHGFYTFSPELFYRVFSKENGFEVTRMILADVWLPNASFFEVPDPMLVGARIEISGRLPAHLLVEAKRIDRVSIFETYPQQSDYQARWEASTTPTVLTTPPKKSITRLIDQSVSLRKLRERMRGALSRIIARWIWNRECRRSRYLRDIGPASAT